MRPSCRCYVGFLLEKYGSVGTVSEYVSHQCPITNASQRAHSAQPHIDVEIMKFLVLSFLDEILSNLFVYVNILAITIQQVCSDKTLLVCSICPNLSQTLHKTPCYGPRWLNKGNIIWIMVLMYNNIISHKISATHEIDAMCECAQSHLSTGALTTWGNCYTTDSQTHIYMKIKLSKTILLFHSWVCFLNWYRSMIYLKRQNNCNEDAIQRK